MNTPFVKSKPKPKSKAKGPKHSIKSKASEGCKRKGAMLATPQKENAKAILVSL